LAEADWLDSLIEVARLDARREKAKSRTDAATSPNVSTIWLRDLAFFRCPRCHKDFFYAGLMWPIFLQNAIVAFFLAILFRTKNISSHSYEEA